MMPHMEIVIALLRYRSQYETSSNLDCFNLVNPKYAKSVYLNEKILY